MTYLEMQGICENPRKAGDQCFPLRCWQWLFPNVDIINIFPINEQIYYMGGVMKPKLIATGVWAPPWKLKESHEQFVFEFDGG